MARSREALLDASWANKAFLAPESSLTDDLDERRRYFTSSSRKFVSAAIGGHFAVNPIPQFTDNCDIMHDAFFSKGIDVASRFWSEVEDDPSQIIHFRPGVPRFNSLTNYFGNFYNVEMGSITRTGRAPGGFYKLGQVVGTIGTIPLQPFILGGAAVRFFFNMPRSKFYYLSPTTYPYRFAVQTMMNGIMANLGMIAGSAGETQNQFYDKSVLPKAIDDTATYNTFAPFLADYGFVNSAGGVDVFAISTSAARLAVDFRKSLEQEIEKQTSELDNNLKMGADSAKWRRDVIDNIISNGVEDSLKKLSYRYVSLSDFESAYESFIGSTEEDEDWENNSLQYPSVTDASDAGTWDRFTKYVNTSFEQFKSERDRGADFVSFRANWTGSQSESFSSSSGESSLSSQINGMSARAREIRFNTADGNIGGGVVGAVIGSVFGAVKDIAAGVLDSVQLSGAIALTGNAFADIQKMYQSSSADLNRTSFTMHFRSWAADDYVRLQNLFLPLAHILPLGLPRATGPGSYDGPFLVEVINQGKTIIREGLVESITVERGVGDVGFGMNKEVLGIDVTVQVADLSSILSVPISGGVSDLGATASGVVGSIAGLVTGDSAGAKETVDSVYSALNKYTYGEDNKYTDYLSTISSVSLDGLIDPKRKWQLRMARMRSDLASRRTASYLGSSVFSMVPGEAFKVLFGETIGRY